MFLCVIFSIADKRYVLSYTASICVHLYFTLTVYTCITTLILSLHYASGAPRGKIRLQTEEVADSKFSIGMQLSASKLDKKDFFGKVCASLVLGVRMYHVYTMYYSSYITLGCMSCMGECIPKVM